MSCCCVTGGEPTRAGLARRLEQHRDQPLQEVRLDLLQQRWDGQLAALLSAHGPRLIVTCRARAEGGGFAGDDRQRLELLSRALQARPRYVDLEASAPRALWQELLALRAARSAGTRLIASCHLVGDTSGAAIAAGCRLLLSRPAEVLKLALQVGDAAELLGLLDALAAERRRVIRVGVGDAGLLTRALPARFGSPWTYVVPDGASPVAAGQLSLGQARRLGLSPAARRALDVRPLALLGGAQVLTSPGPAVYGRLLGRHGLPYVYLPVVTGRPVETLELLERLGCAGLSITMPAKQALVAAATELVPPAERVGAINTLVLGGGGRRVGLNTDVAAVRALVRDRVRGGRALLLGAGGAARAAAVALRELGCAVLISGRSTARTAAVAAALGVRAVTWDQRAAAATGARVIVNATPCGADGVSDPLPAGFAPRAGQLVLDAVLRADGGATPLTARARAAGAEVRDGRAWWIVQGAAQIEALVGRRLTAGEIEEALDAAADQ